MTHLTPIPVRNLRVCRTILSGKGARETVPQFRDTRTALGTKPYGLGVGCVACNKRTGAWITAMVECDGRPLCCDCADEAGGA